MLPKKSKGSGPRSVGRMLAIVARAEIGESVGGVGIGIEFVRLFKFRYFGIELLHICRRRILIVLAEVTHDRTVDLLGSFEGRFPVAPSRKRVAAVVHDAGLDILTRYTHQIDDAPAHAKAHDADPT